MPHRPPPPPPPSSRGAAACRRALAALDASLARATAATQAERIQLLRRLYFADVDKLVASGALQLPP